MFLAFYTDIESSRVERQQVNAAVQTDMDSEEAEEAPKQQRDPDNPSTPAPKKKGRKKKQLL